jgi:hypothetical protein
MTTLFAFLILLQGPAAATPFSTASSIRADTSAYSHIPSPVGVVRRIESRALPNGEVDGLRMSGAPFPAGSTTPRRSAWPYIGGGAAIGGALGLTVGLISKSRSSDCNDCAPSAEVIPLFGAVVGAIAGALTGLIVYLAR